MNRSAEIDLADDTFVVADPAVVARAVAEPHRWAEWWPDLRLTVTEERALEGVRWTVAGAVTGSMEIWLEPYADGVLVHYYLRGRISGPTVTDRARAWKRHVHRLKDGFEVGREPGSSRR